MPCKNLIDHLILNDIASSLEKDEATMKRKLFDTVCHYLTQDSLWTLHKTVFKGEFNTSITTLTLGQQGMILCKCIYALRMITISEKVDLMHYCWWCSHLLSGLHPCSATKNDPTFKQSLLLNMTLLHYWLHWLSSSAESHRRHFILNVRLLMSQLPWYLDPSSWNSTAIKLTSSAPLAALY